MMKVNLIHHSSSAILLPVRRIEFFESIMVDTWTVYEFLQTKWLREAPSPVYKTRANRPDYFARCRYTTGWPALQPASPDSPTHFRFPYRRGRGRCRRCASSSRLPGIGVLLRTLITELYHIQP